MQNPPPLTCYISSDGKTRVSRTIDEVKDAFMSMCLLGAVVYILWFHYQFWRAIPEACRTVSPVFATLGLLIPFFNFYWVFRSYPGLIDSINDWAERSGETARLDKGGTTWLCLFFIAESIFASVPGLSLLLHIATAVLSYQFYKHCKVAIDSLLQTPGSVSASR